jgi:NTP pyrophosphatase (non-canonical NTP hydrolase)
MSNMNKMKTALRVIGNKTGSADLAETIALALQAEGVIGKPGLLFSDLREASARRQAEWPGSEAADLSFRALEVGGETGELLEALKKYRRSQLGIKGSSATLDDIADEMADVAIALDLLAAKLDINLARAIVRKFNATSEKYELATRLDGLDQHPDDIAVERFAARMKAKLAQARREGMAGWDNPLACTTAHLTQLLIKHVHKGDPVDIANFAMMLSERGVEGNDNEITRHTAQPETEQDAGAAWIPISDLWEECERSEPDQKWPGVWSGNADRSAPIWIWRTTHKRAQLVFADVDGEFILASTGRAIGNLRPGFWMPALRPTASPYGDEAAA